jgi:hypothetical protein
MVSTMTVSGFAVSTVSRFTVSRGAAALVGGGYTDV